MLTASGRPAGPGGSEMRTPGSPDRSFGGGEPGAWKTQNRPASSVIRWPETFSSATRFWPLPLAACGLQAVRTALPASDIRCLALLA